MAANKREANLVRDRMVNASSRRLAQATFSILDKLQTTDPAIQIGATGAMFLLLCERFNMTPQDVFSAVTQAMNDADNKLLPQFAAVRMYLENEV